MSNAAARVADAAGNWVDPHAPPWSRPYLRLSRLDRPIGSWLLLMPCWWSAALAAGIIGEIGQLPLIIALFFIGAFAMRGAGCTWNDITDRDLDALVERTRSRPIPAGQGSVPQAGAVLGVQALLCLAAALPVNRLAVMTGLASLLLVAGYPVMQTRADQRPSVGPADTQMQPRRRGFAVCGTAGRCGDAGRLATVRSPDERSDIRGFRFPGPACRLRACGLRDAGRCGDAGQYVRWGKGVLTPCPPSHR